MIALVHIEILRQDELEEHLLLLFGAIQLAIFLNGLLDAVFLQIFLNLDGRRILRVLEIEHHGRVASQIIGDSPMLMSEFGTDFH